MDSRVVRPGWATSINASIVADQQDHQPTSTANEVLRARAREDVATLMAQDTAGQTMMELQAQRLRAQRQVSRDLHTGQLVATDWCLQQQQLSDQAELTSHWMLAEASWMLELAAVHEQHTSTENTILRAQLATSEQLVDAQTASFDAQVLAVRRKAQNRAEADALAEHAAVALSVSHLSRAAVPVGASWRPESLRAARVALSAGRSSAIAAEELDREQLQLDWPRLKAQRQAAQAAKIESERTAAATAERERDLLARTKARCLAERQQMTSMLNQAQAKRDATLAMAHAEVQRRAAMIADTERAAEQEEVEIEKFASRSELIRTSEQALNQQRARIAIEREAALRRHKGKQRSGLSLNNKLRDSRMKALREKEKVDALRRENSTSDRSQAIPCWM